MSINTTAGNAVKFLGLSDSIRADLLKAMLGAAVGGKVTINVLHRCYIGLSCTEPNGDGSNITEPTDWNYKRVKLSYGTASTNGQGVETSCVFNSDYLTLDGDTAKNEKKNSDGTRIPTEIKFNRSTEAWKKTDREDLEQYSYFFLSTAENAPSSGKETGMMAWGELTEPITVEAKNVVPLFEEGKFRLHFPTPADVESIVDAAAAADAENA